MNIDEVTLKTSDFVGQHVNTAEIDGDVDIFATGMVNSLFAMQLVLYVEKEFGAVVENEDLDLENFKSINALCNFVSRKLGLAAR